MCRALVSRRIAGGWSSLVAGVLAVGVILAAGAAAACDTPVYRYAMYRWQPAPYEVYYFHDEPASGEDAKVAERIEKLSDQQGEKANVVYIPIDVSDDPDLQQPGVPADVRSAWQETTIKSIPGYAVVSPRGGEVFVGVLTEADVQAMVDSPKRQELEAELTKGRACVYVLLTHPEAKEVEGNPGLWDMLLTPDVMRRQYGRSNEQARATLKEVTTEVNAGKVKLFAGRSDLFPEEVPEEAPVTPDGAEDKPAHTVSYIEIDRNDPAEKWFIRQLLAVEPDLPEIQQPLVFVTYGRGRALPPYIGRGVHRDLLIESLQFITGACSCTIKDQNPGVDLLMTANWDAAAEKLAQLFGNEEGNENLTGESEFFPELIVPSGPALADGPIEPKPPMDDVDEPTADPTAVAAVDPPSTAEPTDPAEGVGLPAPPSQPPAPPAETEGEADHAAEDHAHDLAAVTDSHDQSHAGDPKTEYDGGLLFTVAIGVGLGLLVLFGATLVMFRGK